MTDADWRALIQAYLEGRIGADAFRRRFLEAFDLAARRRTPVRRSVQDLFYVVEAYAGDPMGRGHDVADDRDLERAAQLALDELGPAVAEPPPRPEPAGPQVVILGGGPGAGAGDFRRIRTRVATFGALGCAGVLAYVLLGVVQLFAVAAQVDAVTGFGPAPSTLIALPLAFLPVIGGVIAFFGAMDVWGWPMWLAAVIFLAIPVAAYIGGWFQWRGRRMS